MKKKKNTKQTSIMGYGVTLMRHKVKFTGKPKSQNYLFLAQIELPYVKWWKRQFYQEMSIPRRIIIKSFSMFDLRD